MTQTIFTMLLGKSIRRRDCTVRTMHGYSSFIMSSMPIHKVPQEDKSSSTSDWFQSVKENVFLGEIIPVGTEFQKLVHRTEVISNTI